MIEIPLYDYQSFIQLGAALNAAWIVLPNLKKTICNFFLKSQMKSLKEECSKRILREDMLTLVDELQEEIDEDSITKTKIFTTIYTALCLFISIIFLFISSWNKSLEISVIWMILAFTGWFFSFIVLIVRSFIKSHGYKHKSEGIKSVVKCGFPSTISDDKKEIDNLIEK